MTGLEQRRSATWMTPITREWSWPTRSMVRGEIWVAFAAVGMLGTVVAT